MRTYGDSPSQFKRANSTELGVHFNSLEEKVSYENEQVIKRMSAIDLRMEKAQRSRQQFLMNRTFATETKIDEIIA